MHQPRSTISATHAARNKSLQDDLVSLTKKAKYLEKQVKDAEAQWKDIMHASERRE
jgi:prefoldin subunit 1